MRRFTRLPDWIALQYEAKKPEGLIDRRIVTGWEYHRGGLGGIWAVWRNVRDTAVWESVEVPHCFNAYDAVDPDAPNYQGAGWYRTRVNLANPYAGGRTLLHFEGAGQKSEVYVYSDRVALHIGGYDEFIVDITDAAARTVNDPANRGQVPIAVMCDNSHDLEMIPSSLNDFELYGGLYRHVSLVYAPAISLERLHIESSIEPGGKGTVSIRARLYNPAAHRDEVRVKIQVADPEGRIVQTASRRLPPWAGLQELSLLTIDSPSFWSPDTPSLY